MDQQKFDFANNNDQPIEGFIGTASEAKLLFILKEPHSDNQDAFWFKNAVDGIVENHTINKRQATRYRNVLGKLAEYIFKNDSEIEEKEPVKDKPPYTHILKQCAYINLYPYNGKSNAVNGNFSKMVNALSKKNICSKNSPDQNLVDFANSRIKLIKDLCNNGIRHIVTVTEIYDLLATRKSELPNHLKMENNPDGFRHCNYTENTKLWEFWHPSYPRINYRHLDNAIARETKK